MTRSYWLVDGEEITTSFAGEGSIVFSMDELYYQKVSEEFVETLEEVVAYRILLTDLIHLFETNIELCNWGRIIHQNEYRRLHRTVRRRERTAACMAVFANQLKHSLLAFLFGLPTYSNRLPHQVKRSRQICVSMHRHFLHVFFQRFQTQASRLRRAQTRGHENQRAS